MNIILLSGGSGKRLWPLSNDVRSKQFIKIFDAPDGGHESMVQRIYRGIHSVDPDAVITIATSKTQVSSIHNQIGPDVGISVEPCRRDTFPAIALAAAYLHDVQGAGEDEPVVVCPVDPYVEDDYFRALSELYDEAEKGTANLVLLGMEPTEPSEKFGYIIPETKDHVSRVLTFKEKPDRETAEKYLARGALWNGGIFAFRLGYVLKRAHELISFDSYEDLYNSYEDLEKISFDYAVVEKEPDIAVVRFRGAWKDLGTWNALTEAMSRKTIGNALVQDSENTYVVNELSVPVVVNGVKDLVIAASPEGFLVSDREKSTNIKPLVDSIDQQVMFAEKSWGRYEVIDVEDDSLTMKVTMNPGHRMNYHSHERRDEIWNVISGQGTVIIDGMEQKVKPGDVVTMAAGTRHTVIAQSRLELIEVQLGRDITKDDKQKFKLED